MKNARNKYENLPEEKEVKREYGKNRCKKNEKKKQQKKPNKQKNHKNKQAKIYIFCII